MATQWTDAASYAVYQADNTSSESMSDDASAAEGGGSCRFIHNQCEKELFTSEYLSRSNKASGHKNLRCFPHCCGDTTKSFCGSGLVVECFLSNCQLVLGRFEEVAKQQPVNSKTLPSPTMSTSVDTSLGRGSLTVGREYPRQELFDDVKMPDQPFGRWFRGTAVPNGGTSSSNGNNGNNNSNNNNNGNASTCFLLNGNRQSWHYGWQSASGNANTLTCVAALASPAFRISSSRKARKTFRSPMNQAALANGAASARSIDELLGSATGNNTAAADAAALFAAAQQQQQQQQRQAPTGFMAGQRDPARRERKRLTRSASLKTDYFSTISFPTIQQQQQLQQQQFQQPQRLSLSSTHPPRFEGLQENRASTPSLPGVGSFLGNPALRLESHSPYTSTPIASSTPSSSSSAATSSRSGPTANTTRLTAAALHQHAYASARPYPYARRDTWSSSLQGMIPEGGGIPMMMMSPGSSPDSYLNRKRNRSTDSDKAITAAIEASEKIHPTLSPVSSPGYTPPMVAPVPTDSELYRRARILQLAFTIVKRIHRFEEVAAKQKEPTPKAGRGALAAYAQLVDLLNDAVEAQVSRLPRRMHKSWGDAESADEGEWDLYEMLKSCEPWLLQEPWWVVLDDDDQQQAGDKEEGALRPLPYVNVFADYYRAIQDAVPSPQDLEVAASLPGPAGAHRGAPQDYFPFGWSRKRSLMAYRAWRVRGIGDSNGSAVAVQFMRWPDDNEIEAVENDEEEEELDDDEAEDSPEEPEEEPLGRRGRQPKRLRTRITIYFSVFSASTLQLRTIVEASLAPAVALTGSPTEADMLRYFKSPSSWEMRSQISQQYTKNL
ncbi:ATP-dependent RNA helicase [Phytophthora cinnamomi]|uniref:ATP-dependent RNA helicase n=1 Tax=Phytophthora cinnamomi TaxID=4785 RepID=UPI00355A4A89|nr:ATP-dependent RNA helicase [Phytophthora cinnamomi]